MEYIRDEQFERDTVDKLIEANKNTPEEQKKKFRWPNKWTRNYKKAMKTKDKVPILFFRNNQMIESMVVPVEYGDLIPIENKCYQFNPAKFWTIRNGFKIQKMFCYREADRMPIDNVAGINSTKNDEVYIKELKFAEVQGMKSKGNLGGWVGYILALAAGFAIAYFVLKGI